MANGFIRGTHVWGEKGKLLKACKEKIRIQTMEGREKTELVARERGVHRFSNSHSKDRVWGERRQGKKKRGTVPRLIGLCRGKNGVKKERSGWPSHKERKNL